MIFNLRKYWFKSKSKIGSKFYRAGKYAIALLTGTILFICFSSCAVLSQRFNSFQPELSYPSAAEIVAQLPSPQKLIAMPLSDHPRLVTNRERFTELARQIKTDPLVQQWFQELQWKANYYVEDVELPRYTTEGAGQLLPVSQGVVERVTTLALVYLLSDEPQYLDRVWQEVATVAQFPDWNPAHFLDTAEMTYGLAIAYDWLYDVWDESQKTLLREAILTKGLQPALQGYSQKLRWTEVENNWNQVCNSGIGMGAIAILSDEPQIASKALSLALQKLPLAMQHYAPDGAWSEGIHYWHYGTLYNTLMLATLSTALGKDFNLSQMSGFVDTGLFPIYLTNQSGLPFNFADSIERLIDAPEMFWLARRFERPVFADYARKYAEPSVMDLIWYDPEQQPMSSLKPDKYFRQQEVASMRSDWQDSEGVFLAFKAGDNQANHGNLDLGTFVLDARGVRWGVDLGRDDYGLPGYFDRQAQRWDYYRMRAEGQNTLVVNPDREPDQNITARAKIVRTKFKSDSAYAIADLTPAYTPEVTSLTRSIALTQQRQSAEIVDEIEAKQPINVFWFMHTNADIAIAPDGKSAILTQDGKKMRAEIGGRGQYYFSQMDAEPLSTSPMPTKQAKNTQLKKLTVTLKSVRSARLTVRFFPL